MAASERVHRYQSALQLNNIGVELLARESYQEALISFQNSLGILKTVAAPAGRVTTNSLNIDRKVHRAMKRLARIDVHAENVERDVRVCVYNRTQVPDLGLTVDAVRLTKIDFSHSLNSLTFGTDYYSCLDTAVVLGNLGISFYMYAQSLQTEKEETNTMLKQCLKVFKVASNVVCDRFALCDDDLEESRVRAVALLLTGNMMHVFKSSDRESDARALVEKYGRLGAIQAQAPAA